jgi:molybdopterin converting factor subunit 1
MIGVTAEYFAVFREQAGCEREELRADVETAAELFDRVAARHGFAESRSRCKVAVNDELAAWDTTLHDGDVVLFFPPVAGG